MLVCVSANHRTAGFGLLERLTGADVGTLEQLIRDTEGIDGGVVLSTCNRFELYLDLRDAEAFDRFLPGLAAATRIPEDDLRTHIRVHGDAKVPEYLFAVSSGLESVAIGEDEIAGQVRRALGGARDAGLTTTELEKLFQTAATTSKGVKAQTNLAGAGRSLVSLALDLARAQVIDWQRANVVLIGTGAYAGASLKALEARGVRGIGVYSPSGRAHTFAERYDVDPIEPHQLAERVSNADVIVTCSATDKYVLGYDLVRNARIAPGAAKSLLVIDLGMPRNVDPLVGKIDTVDVLDLETLRLHAPLDDLGTTELARCIVARAAKSFQEERREQRAATAIASFRELVTGRVDREIGRLASDPASAEALRKLGNSLLHVPTVRIKELARAGRIAEAEQALELLFGIPMPEQAELASPVAAPQDADDCTHPSGCPMAARASR